MEQKFFKCPHCGNIIAYIKSSGVKVVCCGEEMKEIIPGSTEAAVEKHLPVINISGNQVEIVVGSVLHPMEDAHYIEWISVETTKGNQRKILAPGQEPKMCFSLCEGEEIISAYAYCNLHSLWKTKK